MDHIDSLLVQDRVVTPKKNEKACRGDRPENQTNLALDYISDTPKKLSTARLSAYWRVMMDREVDHG